jgi:hypothetical protein
VTPRSAVEENVGGDVLVDLDNTTDRGEDHVRANVRFMARREAS